MVWTAAAAVGVSFVLSACSGKGEPGGAVTGQDASMEKAELVIYSNSGDSQESFDLRFGNALKQRFPNYTIRYVQSKSGTSLPEMIASGTKFDIFFASKGNFEDAMIGQGLEYDMTDWIVKNKIDLTRFEPTIIEAMKQSSGGKLYGLPVFNNVMVLYYNKTIFDKFGVSYPKDGMTWDETLELASKLNRNEGGRQYIGFSANPGKTISLNPFSLPSVDPASDTPTINTNEKWRTLFETMFMKPSMNEGVRAEMTAQKKIADHYTFVREQNLAMYAYQSNLHYALPGEMKNVDWDMAALPVFKELPGVGSQTYPTYFGITKTSEHVGPAMEAIRFLTSDDFQMEMSKTGLMPVLNNDAVKKALGSGSEFKDKHFAAIFYNKFAPIAPYKSYAPKVESVYKAKTMPLALGQTDLNTAFRAAEEEAQLTINESKSR